MNQKKFFVNSNGQLVGPYELPTLLSKVDSGELKATDYMYLEAQDDWVLICTHPKFLATHQAAKPNPLKNQSAPVPREMGDSTAFGEKTVVAQARAKPTAVEPSKETDEWYVLKGKNRYGPFPYLDLLRMLQEKAVFEFDYVWHQGLETWKRIAEVPKFTAEAIREAMNAQEVLEAQVFFRRCHERAEYECPVIIHDNQRVWKGKSLQISEGGAGVLMENAMMLPGQNVYLHFKPSPHSKAFNVLCEIVSKRYVKGVKNKDAPLLYGIKFINIHKQDREAIKYIAEHAA